MARSWWLGEEPSANEDAMRILITGGAGFIGSNATRYFGGRGHAVTLFDNFSRRGARENLEWIRETAPVTVVDGDVRDAAAVRAVVAEARPDAVLHLAGQVAVTTSVTDPRTDFEVNALGTLNVLEALRGARPEALLVYTSTNKVYGALEGRAVADAGARYRFVDDRGVDEEAPLDFHSPYGCSKGAADQYVRDFARIYGLRTVVLRMSCIYGPRQFGVEDQGWVAWFVIAAALGARITVYGDGKQVRDALFIDDLVALFQRLMERPDDAAGQVFNVGGGPQHQLGVVELIGLLAELGGRPIPYDVADWRPGDQRVYVSDVGKVARIMRWSPEVAPPDGIKRLHEWVHDNLELHRAWRPGR
jgi:CDP-paratose 2-epimerase